MIVNHHKEKAFNAISYFVNHTSACNKKKLFKLLFLLDFEHFEQTGRSVTGYDYFAWDMGPVPAELHETIENPDQEFLDNFDIERIPMPDGYRNAISLKNKKPFEEKYFSKRELKMLKDISDRFHDSYGKELEDFTHREGTPWYRVWEGEKRKYKEIPYEYVLDGLPEADREAVIEIAKERAVFLANYS